MERVWLQFDTTLKHCWLIFVPCFLSISCHRVKWIITNEFLNVFSLFALFLAGIGLYLFHGASKQNFLNKHNGTDTTFKTNETTNEERKKNEKKTHETHWNLSLLNINELIKSRIFGIDYRACVNEAEFRMVLWYNFAFMVKCSFVRSLALFFPLYAISLHGFCYCFVAFGVCRFDSSDLQTKAYNTSTQQFRASERWQYQWYQYNGGI